MTVYTSPLGRADRFGRAGESLLRAGCETNFRVIRDPRTLGTLDSRHGPIEDRRVNAAEDRHRKGSQRLIAEEQDFKFQGLVSFSAKQKWPRLIASERRYDLGLDAHAKADFQPANRRGIWSRLFD